MKNKLLKFIIPTIIILLIGSVIGSIYVFVYIPIIEQNKYLESEITNKTKYLAQLRSIENNKEQYEAELIEYKELMKKYQWYFEEYGSFAKLLRMLTDVERRLESEIISINRGENEIQIVMNARYGSIKDFLVELEGINFFYNCNNIVISRADETQFTLNELNKLKEEEYENDMTVDLLATFSQELNFDLATIENEIIKLLEELGFKNAVVSQ